MKIINAKATMLGGLPMVEHIEVTLSALDIARLIAKGETSDERNLVKVRLEVNHHVCDNPGCPHRSEPSIRAQVAAAVG